MDLRRTASARHEGKGAVGAGRKKPWNCRVDDVKVLEHNRPNVVKSEKLQAHRCPACGDGADIYRSRVRYLLRDTVMGLFRRYPCRCRK